MSSLRIAICGGGIGGLIAALTLSRFPNVQVDVYESASEHGEVGAGIGIWPRPWAVIEQLGIDKELLTKTTVKPQRTGEPTDRPILYRKADEPQGYSFYRLPSQGALITLHRVDFQKVLLKAFPKSFQIHLKKRLQSYAQPLAPGGSAGPIRLEFGGGSYATCDVLIGSDGLDSNVRKTMLRELAAHERGGSQQRHSLSSSDSGPPPRGSRPVWTGGIMYRSMIQASTLMNVATGHRALKAFVQYVGSGAYVLAYPVKNGSETLINFVAYSVQYELEETYRNGPSVGQSTKEEIAKMFQGWDEEVLQLLHCLPPKVNKWAIQTVGPLDTFVSGRVALVGDAAHAMTPHQGSGAGQAIEDAYLLCTLIGQVASSNQPPTSFEPRSSPSSSHSQSIHKRLVEALNIYDRVRRPKAQVVAEKSRNNGMWFTLHEPDGREIDLSGGYSNSGPANGYQNGRSWPNGVNGQHVREPRERAHEAKILSDVMERACRGWEWAWKTDEESVEKDVRLALGMLGRRRVSL